MIAPITLLFSFGLTVLVSATDSATNSTTSVFLPIVDAQTLVASLSQENGDIKTLIIKCPDGTDSSDCGFPTPVTVTAGPSTLALTTTIGNSMIVDLKCGVENSTKASCTQIYTGPASLYTTVSGSDGSKTTTWTASQTLDSGKVTYLPVTITAGLATSTSSTASKTNAAPAPTHAGGLKQIVVAVIAQVLMVL